MKDARPRRQLGARARRRRGLKAGALVVVVVARALSHSAGVRRARDRPRRGRGTDRRRSTSGAGTLLSRDGARVGVGRGALFARLASRRVRRSSSAFSSWRRSSACSLGRPLERRPWRCWRVRRALPLRARAASVPVRTSDRRRCRSWRPERSRSLPRLPSASSRRAPTRCFSRSLSVDTRDARAAAPTRAQRWPTSARPRAAGRAAAGRADRPAGARHGRVLPLGHDRACRVVGRAEATAVFGVASGIAFGLLMVPNAITTALLPRLSAEATPGQLVACTRRVLAWTSRHRRLPRRRVRGAGAPVSARRPRARVRARGRAVCAALPRDSAHRRERRDRNGVAGRRAAACTRDAGRRCRWRSTSSCSCFSCPSPGAVGRGLRDGRLRGGGLVLLVHRCAHRAARAGPAPVTLAADALEATAAIP